MAIQPRSNAIDLALLGEGFVKGAHDGFAHFHEKNHGILLTDTDLYEFSVHQLSTHTPDRYNMGFLTGWIIALHEHKPGRQFNGETSVIPLGKNHILTQKYDLAFLTGYQVGHIHCLFKRHPPCIGAFDVLQRLFAALNVQPNTPRISKNKRYLYLTGELVGWLNTAARQSDFFVRITEKDEEK
jgi:hypothetical protein